MRSGIIIELSFSPLVLVTAVVGRIQTQNLEVCDTVSLQLHYWSAPITLYSEYGLYGSYETCLTQILVYCLNL